MSRHIIEALGLSRITVENGKVVDVTEPQVEYCPLFDHHRGIKKLTKDVIAENIQFRIDDFGMCTPKRQLRMKDFLNFGISEILCTLLEKHEIDSVVMVLEGCGTVIVNEPELVQGIGGRVSGLVETSPIPELVPEIGENLQDIFAEIVKTQQHRVFGKCTGDIPLRLRPPQSIAKICHRPRLYHFPCGASSLRHCIFTCVPKLRKL